MGEHVHGHSHVAAGADRRWLSGALALVLGYMLAELVVGVVAHSLALLSDAAHMLTDAGAIGLALVAMHLAARPARGRYTYGLKRVEILSAQANGITLLVLAGWLAFEAIRRLLHPAAVDAAPVLVTALVGVAVNLVAAGLLSRANRDSLNVHGAFAHILTDLVGFIATALAALVILATGFTRADPIATLVVVVLMVRAGIGLVRASGRIFLEAAPVGLDPDAVGDRLVSHTGVVEVHDLHVWTITSGQPALSAHVLVEPGGDCHAVRRGLEETLRAGYGITHTTLQVDHVAETLLTLGRPGDEHCADAHGPVHGRDPHDH